MILLDVIVEAEAVTRIARWIDPVREWLTSEKGRQVMRERILLLLQSGAIGTMTVIEAARAGHADADQALRAHYI